LLRRLAHGLGVPMICPCTMQFAGVVAGRAESLDCVRCAAGRRGRAVQQGPAQR
jgi:hypothetical protein